VNKIEWQVWYLEDVLRAKRNYGVVDPIEAESSRFLYCALLAWLACCEKHLLLYTHNHGAARRGSDGLPGGGAA
jgi:hypothetical protein